MRPTGSGTRPEHRRPQVHVLQSRIRPPDSLVPARDRPDQVRHQATAAPSVNAPASPTNVIDTWRKCRLMPCTLVHRPSACANPTQARASNAFPASTAAAMSGRFIASPGSRLRRPGRRSRPPSMDGARCATARRPSSQPSISPPVDAADVALDRVASSRWEQRRRCIHVDEWQTANDVRDEHILLMRRKAVCRHQTCKFKAPRRSDPGIPGNRIVSDTLDDTPGPLAIRQT